MNAVIKAIITTSSQCIMIYKVLLTAFNNMRTLYVSLCEVFTCIEA